MERKWWKERVVYQIYPRSFYDSNGDGIGDLNGILQKLDYLEWLGVGMVWLNPIYDSPNDDMGYDIRDYEKIMTEFGTMADFDRLLEELHRRDIKLIMDLVVNHSSDEHIWFVESRKSKNNPYRDYYYWREGKGTQPPNNWESFFSPSAWKYDDQTDEWYLHLFSEKQPDLNWTHPNLRHDVYEMMNRWLDKGVDGFRMDVINVIAKRDGLPDAAGNANPFGYVFADQHFANQPKLHDYLKEMRKSCFEMRNCMCVGETPFVTPALALDMVSPERKELDMVFHFQMMDIDCGTGGKWTWSPWKVADFKRITRDWQMTLKDAWNSLYWANHDQPRTVSRFGCTDSEELRVRSAKTLAAALYLQKGTPYIYQGEEIGMTNTPFQSVTDLMDIESLNAYRLAEARGDHEAVWQVILKKGRDNARTPMLWDASPHGGFTTGKPWLMANPNYTEINVEAAMRDPNSILHFFRELIRLRSTESVLIDGNFIEWLPEHAQIFAYERVTDTEKVLVVCNLSGEDVENPLADRVNASSILLASNAGRGSFTRLSPWECVVVREA